VTSHDEIPGLGPRTGRPRPNTAIDLANQKLSPTEGFILSRVDGRMSYDEICMVSGLSRDETLRILRDLKQARLILGPGEVAVGASRASPPCLHVHQRPQGLQPQARGRRTRREARRANLRPRGQGRRTSDPGWPARTARRRVARGPWRPGGMAGCTFGTEGAHRPAAPSAPAAFGVGPAGVGKDADASTVRRAFGAASKELHPDRLLWQEPRRFRAKLGAIFAPPE